MPAALLGTGKEAASIVHISPIIVFALLAIGLGVGVISGMVGIGGGVLVIPILMMLFGFSQAKANGTSLAMLLPPIGIFAVYTYQKAGNINWAYAMLLAGGFAVGGYIGGVIVNHKWIDEVMIRRLFILLLLYVIGRMVWRSDPEIRATTKTLILMAA